MATMMKTKSIDGARAEAVKTGRAFGLSVFDGFYYVGTVEQLHGVGAAGITTPIGPESPQPEPPAEFYLGDDGTLDTVIRCAKCGGEERYTYDGAGWSGEDSEQDDEAAYDSFVEWAMDDAVKNHECREDGGGPETVEPATAPADLTPAERFMWEHAGWSYDPKRETAEEGRVRCARELAAAEQALKDAGWGYEVLDDPDGDVAKGDTDYDGPWSGIVLRDGGVLRYEFALWGIDTASAEGDYGRAVAAGLALEAMAAGALGNESGSVVDSEPARDPEPEILSLGEQIDAAAARAWEPIPDEELTAEAGRHEQIARRLRAEVTRRAARRSGSGETNRETKGGRQ